MRRNASLALLLEDEPLISMDLEMTLEGAGFNVSTVMTVAEAHAWLDIRRPDVVIVDIELRDGRSTEVVERLVENNIPFVVHSGDTPSLYVGTPFAVGAWLGKPAAPDDLVEMALSLIADQALYPPTPEL